MRDYIRFKDIYPIMLFVTLLMMWAAVGSSKTAVLTAPSFDWPSLFGSPPQTNEYKRVIL